MPDDNHTINVGPVTVGEALPATVAETTSRHRKGLKDACITCWRPWPCPTAVAEAEQQPNDEERTT